MRPIGVDSSSWTHVASSRTSTFDVTSIATSSGSFDVGIGTSGVHAVADEQLSRRRAAPPYRRGQAVAVVVRPDAIRARRADQALAHAERLDLRPADEALAELAAALGAGYGLRAADSVHLATAERCGRLTLVAERTVRRWIAELCPSNGCGDQSTFAAASSPLPRRRHPDRHRSRASTMDGAVGVTVGGAAPPASRDDDTAVADDRLADGLRTLAAVVVSIDPDCRHGR
jgi:hypothetical protein